MSDDPSPVDDRSDADRGRAVDYAVVVDVVRNYVVERVRQLVTGHDELFERGQRLYGLIDDEIHAQRGAGGKERLKGLREHPIARTVLSLLPSRARRIIDAAIVGMRDNRRIMSEVDRQVRERQIATRAEVEELYREVLVQEVPFERSLDNVAAIAESTEVAHELLTARGFIGRNLRDKGFAFVREHVLRDPRMRAEATSVWDTLADEPDQLLRLARSVREHGPGIVRGLYGE